MIFVTVGTHEQQFNRLVECVDRLKGEGKITEDVFIQTGYSTYEPKHCQWSKLIPYDLMQKYYAEARIIITHGGPASYIDALDLQKTPVVVPRQAKFGEHVNDHQVDHVQQIAARKNFFIPVYDISELEHVILDYDTISKERGVFESNNAKFNEEFTKQIYSLFPEDCL